MSFLVLWALPLLFMLSFGGMAYVVVKALRSGADTYATEYAEDTARQFEDLFLFIPPERINQVAWAGAAAAAGAGNGTATMFSPWRRRRPIRGKRRRWRKEL